MAQYVQQAKVAKTFGNLEGSIKYYRLASEAMEAVAALYLQHGVEIPRRIKELDYEIEQGFRSHRTLSQIFAESGSGKPSAPEAPIEGTLGLYAYIIGNIGKAADIVMEVTAPLFRELEEKGYTAHLELNVAKEQLFSLEPMLQIPITVQGVTHRDIHDEIKTTKEGIIEGGGNIRLFLKPGLYEISSPFFEKSIVVDVKEGQNHFRVILQ